MAKPSTHQSFFGWLGRQVGHVKKAATTDPTPQPKVVYRKDQIEEKEMPNQPGVKLRRTTIDEVLVESKHALSKGSQPRQRKQQD